MLRALILAAVLALVAAAPASAQLPPIGGEPPPEEGEEPRRDPPPMTPSADPGPDWLMEGGDPTHRFWAGDSGVAPPLEVRWTASVAPNRPADLLVADGLVVVLTSNERYEFRIVALDAASGARRWEIAAESYVDDVAIAAGKLLVSQYGGLRAYDLATGAPAWSSEIDSGELTPAGGEVYFWAAHDRDGPGGSNPNVALHAFDVATGRELWKTEEESSDQPHGRLMVSGDRIFHATICQNTAHDRRDGAEIWHDGGSCSGGWQGEHALVGDKVVSDDRVLSAADGSVVRDSFPRAARVIAGDRVITVADENRAAVAQDLVSGAELWRWSDDAGTFDSDYTQFAAAGDRVWVQRAQSITVLDRHTGAPQWMGELRGGTRSAPVVAGGLALMRRETDIVALGPAGTVTPRVELRVDDQTIEYGEEIQLGVTVGFPDLTFAGPVTIEADEFPADGFAPGPVVLTRPDGLGGIALRPSRLTAYRAVAQGGLSEERVVTVLPRVRLRALGTGGGRARLRATVDVPPEAQLRRRKIVVYAARRGGRRYDRLGSGRLRGNGGRFRATFRVRQTHMRAKDFITVCIRGINRYGLGFADRLERRCGARRVSVPARAATASRGTRSPRATR